MRCAALLAPALLLLAACGGGDGNDTTAAAPVSSTPASASEDQTVGELLDSLDPDRNEPTQDVTADLLALGAGAEWTTAVTLADQTEPDRVEVDTTIVDPRGGSTGSPEAQQAIAVCQAAVQLLTVQGVAEPHVSVFESNGTSFVLAGHPSYGPDCTEV